MKIELAAAATRPRQGGDGQADRCLERPPRATAPSRDAREGTIELMRAPREPEKQRDIALAKYHHYEVASAAFQIGIVLASATVITGMVALIFLRRRSRRARASPSWRLAIWAPHVVHLF